MLVPQPIASGDGFAGWQALNDTIMGGRSQGAVQTTSEVCCFRPLWSPKVVGS